MRGVSYRQFGTILRNCHCSHWEELFSFSFDGLHSKLKLNYFLLPYSLPFRFHFSVSLRDLVSDRWDWQRVTSGSRVRPWAKFSPLVSWPIQKSLDWLPLLGIVSVSNGWFIPPFTSFTTKSQVAIPGTSSWLGLCPLKEEGRVRDTYPHTRVSSWMNDSHNSPPVSYTHLTLPTICSV